MTDSREKDTMYIRDGFAYPANGVSYMYKGTPTLAKDDTSCTHYTHTARLLELVRGMKSVVCDEEFLNGYNAALLDVEKILENNNG